MILGGTVNTAKTINICSNTISGNPTYYTSGIAVQNNTATTIVTIDSNQINYMNGNLYNFSGSQFGSKVYLINNIYDVNSVFKLTSYGSASIASIGNTYGGGVSSTGYQPDDK